MENFNNEVSGIYKIENNINNKIYIGKAKNILKRWKAHKGFERKRYPNKTLYKAFDKYGIENFDFSIIEKCDEEELNEKEKYWIDYYDSFYQGYNDTLGGDGYLCGGGENSPGNVLTQEEVNIIYDMLLQGKSAQAIMKIIPNATDANISCINTGATWHNDNFIYPLKKRSVNHKFSDDEVLDIREKAFNGCHPDELAKEYNVLRATIDNLVSGKTYKDLPVLGIKEKRRKPNSNRLLTEEEVLYSRKKIYEENQSILHLWEQEFQSKIKYAAFRNMIRGITYKDIGGIQDAI